MRPAAFLFAAVSLAVFSATAWMIGVGGTARVERATRNQTSAALDAAGETWAQIKIDGLIVRITGQAPGEPDHLNALKILSRLVGSNRIQDDTSIAPQIAAAPPDLRLEILRSGPNITLIGRIPSEPGVAVILSAIDNQSGISNVTDLLEIAAENPPDGWPEALAFGLRALETIQQGKIILGPGTADITAVSDNAQLKEALIASLTAQAPQNLALSLNISSPPPVIAPFVFSFDLTRDDPHLADCSADTPESRDRIFSAVRRAGAPGALTCKIGLGAPSPSWSRAVDLAIAALEQMNGGMLRIEDTNITLTAPTDLPADQLEALIQDLETALPPMFSVEAIKIEKPAAQAAPPEPARPVFSAELLLDGAVRLTGPVPDGMSDQAVQTYATSLFGFDKVTSTLRQTDGLPEGWPGRVLNGLETLSLLSVGRIEITDESVTITGRGDSETIAQEVRDVLRLRLGGGDNTVDVQFDAALIPPAKPDLHPAQCEIRIARLLEISQIAFAPNAVEIEEDSLPIIDAIAVILRQCPQTRFEIGGHTDSQGREVLNMGLSQSRADAVLDALLAREVLISELTAHGYGETQPVTTNETEEGRLRNRRIEFKMLEDANEQD